MNAIGRGGRVPLRRRQPAASSLGSVLWFASWCCTTFLRIRRRSTGTTAHIPLTKKLPGLRRYTISRNTASIRGGEPYYLVAELDWDDMTALRQAFRSPQGHATAEDVPKFAGRGVRSMIYELEEV